MNPDEDPQYNVMQAHCPFVAGTALVEQPDHILERDHPEIPHALPGLRFSQSRQAIVAVRLGSSSPRHVGSGCVASRNSIHGRPPAP